MPSGTRDLAKGGMTSVVCEQIIMRLLFHLPHRRAPMLGETIQRAKFSQRAQFVFGKRNAPFEIFERIELSILPLLNEFISVFLP